jgi:hypothetical protein
MPRYGFTFAQNGLLRPPSGWNDLIHRSKESTLANNSKEARDRAEYSFKKQEQRAREGAKAMADYEAEGRATREKTARLKSLRMAQQAGGNTVLAETAPVAARSAKTAMKPRPAR